MSSSQLQMLIEAAQLRVRIAELGAEISADYARGEPPVLVCILRGAVYFAVDLTRELTIPFALDFMAISNYGQSSRPHGIVRITKDLDENIVGRPVLVIEDIVDTGLSLAYLLRNLQARSPAEVKVCTLVDSPTRRVVNVPIHYRGFEIPDKFVVGYGLDYHQQYRNLPYIAILGG